MNNIKNETKFSARSNLGTRTRARKISFEAFIAIVMLVFAVGFNLWIYRTELTSQVDPNDNTFQFALVYRTNQIWDYANKTCSGNFLSFIPCHLSLLVDHWVPNWNEGYNLPFYYSHVPQIVIVAGYRLLSLFTTHYSLFTFYHVVIYLLLCIFPVSMFIALKVAGFPWLTAGLGALMASHISTDGLYGLDPPSFLWRGYGLSSQLFAMIWLPVALAFSLRAFGNRRFLVPAVAFLVLTTAGHLGIGMMAFLSLIPLALTAPILTFLEKQPWQKILDPLKQNAITLTCISVAAIFFLSYWILPAMTLDRFHNFSFWDPVWKFDSYGAKEIINRLGNGALFDFGRLPVFTALVFIGLFTIQYSEFTLLFFFFLLLYFGRTTWGNIINLIPAMQEFHLSRFIVGIHAAGLFLAPVGLAWIIQRISKLFTVPSVYFVVPIAVILIALLYPQTFRYAAHNDRLIVQANTNYQKQAEGANSLVAALQDIEKTAPGRVYAGRGGGWGKDFLLAETTMTMYLGNFALPTVLWMPETWSPNADTEQYFREDKAHDYDLFGIRYVAAPADLAKENIQPFWRLIKENPSWKIYEVPTSSYFTAGVRAAVVAADKYSRTNVVRLWIQSDDPKNGLYPELTFDTKNYPAKTGLPNFKMIDEVTFQVPDGSTHNVFTEPPKYMGDISVLKNLKIISQTADTDMIFTAHVSVPEDCGECMVILKQTYHPNWRVTIDGKSAEPIITFPFYIGIPVPIGDHEIIASYQPSRVKIMLLWISLITLISFFVWSLTRKLGVDKTDTDISH